MQLTIQPDVLAAIRAHAEAAYPKECVGALLGLGAAVQSVRALTNDSCAGFEISAQEYLATEKQAEADGLRLLGFYHSHPDGLGQPSLRDLENAVPGWWMMIVPVLTGVAGAPAVFFLGDSSEFTRLGRTV